MRLNGADLNVEAFRRLSAAANPRDPLRLQMLGSRQGKPEIQKLTVNVKQADRAVAHPPTPRTPVTRRVEATNSEP